MYVPSLIYPNSSINHHIDAGIAATARTWKPSTAKGVAPTDGLFVELDGLNQPYAIAEWGQALARVDRTRPADEKSAPTHLYSFPPPKNLIASLASRSTKLYESWLHIRHHWIGQVSSSAPGREIAIKGQTWRDILKFGLGGPEPEVPKTGVMLAIQKEMGRYDLKVSDDGRVLTFKNGERVGANPSGGNGIPTVNTVSWKDRAYDFVHDGIPAEVQREVLWELHELNFRFDLIKLDQCLTLDGSDDAQPMLQRQDRLLKCWGTPSHDFYAPSHIIWPSRNKWLAADKVEDRLSAIRYLHDLCKSWTQFPMPADMGRIDRSLTFDEANKLEVDLYAAIQQTFYDLFGRPMVSPRRLYRKQ